MRVCSGTSKPTASAICRARRRARRCPVRAECGRITAVRSCRLASHHDRHVVAAAAESRYSAAAISAGWRPRRPRIIVERPMRGETVAVHDESQPLPRERVYLRDPRASWPSVPLRDTRCRVVAGRESMAGNVADAGELTQRAGLTNVGDAAAPPRVCRQAACIALERGPTSVRRPRMIAAPPRPALAACGPWPRPSATTTSGASGPWCTCQASPQRPRRLSPSRRRHRRPARGPSAASGQIARQHRAAAGCSEKMSKLVGQPPRRRPAPCPACPPSSSRRAAPRDVGIPGRGRSRRSRPRRPVRPQGCAQEDFARRSRASRGSSRARCAIEAGAVRASSKPGGRRAASRAATARRDGWLRSVDRHRADGPALTSIA